MDEILGPQTRLPSRKLGVALICEIEIVEADLLNESSPMEHPPNFFGQAADDKVAVRRLESFVETQDR